MIRYWLARLGWTVWTPAPACSAWRCARPRVGASAWCRGHTDRILAGESTDGWTERST